MLCIGPSQLCVTCGCSITAPGDIASGIKFLEEYLEEILEESLEEFLKKFLGKSLEKFGKESLEQFPEEISGLIPKGIPKDS